MAYMNRPTGYGSYYEEEKEVIRGPGDPYASDYRVEGYGNGGYPVGHPLYNGGGYVDKVSEVVYESTPGYGTRRHHRLHNNLGGRTEIIEKEEIVRENAYDPSKRYY